MSIRISRYRAVVGRTRSNIGDTLSFIEDGEFTTQFRECGLNDDDLEAIQIAITATPGDGDVVPVSKNIRDLFYAMDAETTVTIRFVFFEQASTVLLLAAYFGDVVKPMSEAGAAAAEAYITTQMEFFERWHTR